MFGNKTAMIVVNMSNGFTLPESPLCEVNNDVLMANQRLLTACRLSAVPICFTTLIFNDEAESSVLRSFKPNLNILKPNSKWIELNQSLEPLDDEPIFEQNGPSSFYNTNVSAWLVLNDIDSLIIVGAQTSGYIQATVVGGIQHNYPIWVAKDACADRIPDSHNTHLSNMAAHYAEVKTVDDIIEHIASSSELCESDYI